MLTATAVNAIGFLQSLSDSVYIRHAGPNSIDSRCIPFVCLFVYLSVCLSHERTLLKRHALHQKLLRATKNRDKGPMVTQCTI